MPKPVDDWTEEDILALPKGENDTFERKGSKLLDLTVKGVDQNVVLDELAKQLSAFANTGGGQLIYGVTNSGEVDHGGVSCFVKTRRSTKEWLEGVIPRLTEFEVVGFRIKDIPRSGESSAIEEGKAIYIIDIPSSERAPHQSARDKKYYVRLGSSSQPAPHQLIEDIRNRSRHPQVEVHDLVIQNAVVREESVGTLQGDFVIQLIFRFGVRNVGKVIAKNSCLRFAGKKLSGANIGGVEGFLRPSNTETALFEVTNPLYPGMGIVITGMIQIPGTIQILDPKKPAWWLASDVAEKYCLQITSYADSAPARTQEVKPFDFDPDRLLEGAFSRAEQTIKNVAYNRRF